MCRSGSSWRSFPRLNSEENQEHHMDLQQTIVFLVIGGIAGLLAGLIVKGGGLGLVGNIVVGVLGALLGGWLFKLMKISIGGEWLGPLVTATAGAVVLLFVLGIFKKKA
jgi:uncharacterized membrane protein YeaQ/YmgE (transglycosylase-associated protein family)